jgi:ubiquinone/menaquinone biosynthesis C-methylase UbiE
MQEQKKYDLLWAQCPAYRECSPGELFAPLFLNYFKVKAGETLLDFGCGTGRAASAFLEKQLKVTLIDFSAHALDEQMRHLIALIPDQLQFVQADLATLPETLPAADWIYCCDVLEHIPEAQVDAVLKGMARCMKKGGYFSICLQEDQFGKAFDLVLHVTVRDKAWWLKKISSYFSIAQEASPVEGLYLNCCLSV